MVPLITSTGPSRCVRMRLTLGPKINPMQIVTRLQFLILNQLQAKYIFCLIPLPPTSPSELCHHPTPPSPLSVSSLLFPPNLSSFFLPPTPSLLLPLIAVQTPKLLPRPFQRTTQPPCSIVQIPLSLPLTHFILKILSSNSTPPLHPPAHK